MIIENFIVGPLETNCYIIHDYNEGVLIDVGGIDLEQVIEYIDSNKISIRYILATHGHFDHIMGVNTMKEKYNASFLINEKDLELVKNANRVAGIFNIKINEISSPDGFIREGDLIHIGNIELKVIETPGHTLGSVCFLVNEYLFTGDTLFAGTIGRTDLGGSEELMMESLKKLKMMDDKIKIMPGHGVPSILGYEKKNNPFLLQL